jgi:hypothetical protein
LFFLVPLHFAATIQDPAASVGFFDLVNMNERAKFGPPEQLAKPDKADKAAFVSAALFNLSSSHPLMTPMLSTLT